jgi:S-adenosylmethionine:diacylglycerol 3-amino-3-carboxypropyl transferase
LADDDDERGGAASVVCADTNPHQLALGEVKLALACSNLSVGDVLVFLGMDRSLDTCEKRLEIFETVVEPRLPDHVAELLRRDLLHEIRVGIAQFGSEINSFRYLQRELAKLGFSARDVWDRRVDLGRLERECAGGIGTPQGFARAAFLEESLPVTYRGRWDRCLQTFYPALHRAVADPAFQRTFNKALMLKGCYGEDCLPDWLAESARERLRARRSRVAFVNRPIDRVESDARFDLISTSNIFDWMEVEDGAKILSTLVRDQLADDGRLLVRTAFSPARDLVRLVPNARRSCDDGATPEDLARVDFSHFWYRNPDGIAVLARK